MTTPADTDSMTEEVKEAWDADKAEDYPVHDLDDSAAEEDPANSSGFIGGHADQRVKKDTSDEPEPDPENSDTVKPDAEAEANDDDAPTVDAGLVSRATEAGLSQDDISDFTESQLERVLTHLDRALLRPESTQKKADPEPPTTGNEKAEDFSLNLDPEYHDPEVIKAFKSLDERHQAQNKQLREEISELRTHARNQVRQAYQEGFDNWVNSLPEQYATYLGTGPTVEMDENSDAFKARYEVALAADAMESRILQNGKRPPNRKEMLKRGLHAILGDKVIQIERAADQKVQDSRRSRTTALPTHKRPRDPKQPLGDKAAHDWVRGFMQREGLSNALEEGLPDGQDEGI